MTQDIIKPPRKEPLQIFLTRQYRTAKLNPGKPERRHLRGGLRVDMLYKVGADGISLNVQLHRKNVAPSLIEWKTVLKHLGICHKAPDNCYLSGTFVYTEEPNKE